ncbi:MAG TPA: peptide ABC transporter substrate-binding protein [Ktedonobacteraceae bacterium]
MRNGKKFTMGFLPTLLVLVAMLMVACGGGGGTSNVTPTAAPAKAPASQQVFRDPLPVSDIATFDPGQATDLYSAQSIYMVFTGLVQLDDQLQVKPQLASSWTTSSDNLTWTFTLKPGLKFSDGTPLTSADVVYSIDRALSPQIASLNGVSLTYLGLINDSDKRVNGKISTLIGDSLVTPDANTVVIKLNKPGAYFLDALTYQTSWVVEKKVIDQFGTKWTDHLADNGGQGGAGPWVVTSWDHTKGITFAPSPNYYGAKPQLSQVQFLFYKSSKTAYEAYQANQLDATPIPSANFDQAKTMPGFSKTPSLAIFYFAMNYLTKPFDNINIRQAFELALNKDVLLQAVFKGRGVPTCHIVPNGMPGYNSSLTCPAGAPTSGDNAKAQSLFNQGLQEEGLTASTLPAITLTYPNGNPDTDNYVTSARQMWKTVLGVDVKAQAIDFNQLLTDIVNSTNNAKGLQLWWIGWIADYPDPQDWTTLQFAKGSPNNNMNYGQNSTSSATLQQQAQQQLAQADVTGNQTQRLQMYNTAEQQLVNDVAWLSLWQDEITRLVRPYVTGIKFNSEDLRPSDDWASIYIATH